MRCTRPLPRGLRFFFFHDTATTEIYTLSLHDALPISPAITSVATTTSPAAFDAANGDGIDRHHRSEEHTSELQSRLHLVCRLLLEKKKNRSSTVTPTTSSRSKQEATAHASPSHHRRVL